MNAFFADACMAFFYVIAPALLLIRFIWPRVLPRWAVLVSAAQLGGAAFYFRELLIRADMMERVKRFDVPELGPPMPVEGMVLLQSPRPVDFVLGAALELVYLLLWLVPYGVTQILRKRSKQEALT